MAAFDDSKPTLTTVTEYLREIENTDFYGYLTFEFMGGKLSLIKKQETLLPQTRVNKYDRSKY